MRWGGSVAALLILAAAIAAGIAWAGYRSFLETPLHRREQAVVLNLPEGTSFLGLLDRLEHRGLVEHRVYWRVLGWQMDAGQRIKAGEYRIPAGMKPAGLLQRIIAGDVVQHDFTIIEGWTFAEMMDALADVPALKHTLAGLDGEAIMKRLGHDHADPEGWFLPETYLFPRGATDLSILRRAHRAMHATLRELWPQREKHLPYDSPYEALILASIVEKETALPEERPRVAGVFVRRLTIGMRLQADPTVIYGLGPAFEGNLTLEDLRTDTPYNTYTRAGLPPTPISLPGRASIKAALHPANGDALYFVATGEGGHEFSATLAEHRRAVRRYQKNGQ